ncbi:uncharacterized protein LOC135695391 [Rhopilema esculentum]|uniref:uncharacterized protein LOC135695391 n=1 Tax=Rhopilema esculentum TaxID=499914 RepID=UPI0031E41A34
MICIKAGISFLALLSLMSPVKVAVTNGTHTKTNDTITEGSGFNTGNLTYHENYQGNNRSRKDYIVAIEDDAPMEQHYDPVFMMLKKLAKRTQGKMAVLDYSNANKRFFSPFLSRMRYRNPLFNDDETNYDDDEDNSEDEEEDYNFRPGGKQSLIGRNVINNFLGLKRMPMEEERLGPRDNVRTLEDEAMDNRGAAFAPPVVYEMEGERQDDYDDDDNDEEDDNAYSRGLFGKPPMFLFGNGD